MENYKVYDDVKRKVIQLASGYKYLVDFVCLEKREGKPDRYLAAGYETETNKRYGWVELNDDDPVKAFVSYVEATDQIELDDTIKEFDKKHP